MELHGRRKIHTSVEKITADNVIKVVNSALEEHALNVVEEDYLYWYRRGVQPVLGKTKTVREEINNILVENVASEIVTFKDGYFLTQPTFYTSRRDDENLTEQVSTLNDYLYLSGKQQADNDIVDWFHTVGLGVLYANSVPNDNKVIARALDPRQAFDIYSYDIGEDPVAGVNVVIRRDDKNRPRYYFDVFTEENIFHLAGAQASDDPQYKTVGETLKAKELLSVERNVLGEIPIIEYQYDRNRMGAFEVVISLIDAISFCQSNRADSVEQFVNSLLVFYNCQLGTDDDTGKPITPKMIREQGAIFLKSIGQDRADLKEISSVLDQSQTQVFVDDLLHQVCNIAGMPFTGDASTSDSSNVGATFLRNGWQTADTYAHNTEDLYRASNKRFDKILLKILKRKDVGLTLKESDIDVKFTRSELDNLLVKTQGALNLKQIGLAPELVLAKSGLSSDPVGDVDKSKKYIEAAYAIGETGNRDNRNDTAIGTGRRDSEEPIRNNDSIGRQASPLPKRDDGDDGK